MSPNVDPVEIARLLSTGYQTFIDEFIAITRRARGRFEARDWKGAQDDQVERIDLRAVHLGLMLTALGERLQNRLHERPLWQQIKAAYAVQIEALPDREVAQTYYNSVTRKVFSTVGVDAAIEFISSKATGGLPAPAPDLLRRFERGATTEGLVREILTAYAFSVPFRGLDEDVQLSARALERHFHEAEAYVSNDWTYVELLRQVFYRGSRAYLVGRIPQGEAFVPCVFCLGNDERGVFVDAVLLVPREVSVVFSYTRSYFNVELEVPRQVASFLRSILPRKRLSELYIAIGYHRHGKTELYREILNHLESTTERFEPAHGDKGLVMAVFTLPTLHLVFKVIRDKPKPPKSVTPDEVREKYHQVFRSDRAGRLIDAQEYEHFKVPEARFSKEVLDELLEDCPSIVKRIDGHIELAHVYVERRVTPLNIYLREQDDAADVRAMLDFGRCLKDLAATNTFPGDLLLKNFGVTRNGRVVFYDYDELQRMTEVRFRELPTPSEDDEMRGEAWFFVGEHDVFPEEFPPFWGLLDHVKAPFLERHGDVITARFWRDMQKRIEAGEIVDILPYDDERRLHESDRPPATGA